MRTDPISIFIVLKTGGPVYNSRYVNTVARNIRSNVTYPHEIVCLTDDPSNITEVDRIVPMLHNYPKWWGKIELFREDITQNKHCLFIDLDTVICKNIDQLCATDGSFLALYDFYRPTVLQTGIMKWSVNKQSKDIYANFITTDFSKYIHRGDHEWIGKNVTNFKFLQHTLPDYICSYKKDLAYIAKGLKEPNIICFHGDPRPHTIKHDFITKHWKY